TQPATRASANQGRRKKAIVAWTRRRGGEFLLHLPSTMSGARDLEPLVMDLISRDAIKVPLHPPVAMRLQKVVAAGKYGAADLAKLVGEDQSLAATLLRYANSPKYRGIEQITSLHDAITRMGA